MPTENRNFTVLEGGTIDLVIADDEVESYTYSVQSRDGTATLAAGTPNGTDDYVALHESGGGDAEFALPIVTVDDNVYERTETFFIDYSAAITTLEEGNPPVPVVTPFSGVITVNIDDSADKPKLEIHELSVREDEKSVLPVLKITADHPAAFDYTIHVVIGGEGDFKQTTFDVVMPAMSQTVELNLDLNDDYVREVSGPTLAENFEKITVTASSEFDTATSEIQVVNDDGPIVILKAITGSEILAYEGVKDAPDLTVTLDKAVPYPILLTFISTDPQSGEQITTFDVTIQAGSTSATVDAVFAKDDQLPEYAQMFKLDVFAHPIGSNEKVYFDAAGAQSTSIDVKVEDRIKWFIDHQSSTAGMLDLVNKFHDVRNGLLLALVKYSDDYAAFSDTLEEGAKYLGVAINVAAIVANYVDETNTAKGQPNEAQLKELAGIHAVVSFWDATAAVLLAEGTGVAITAGVEAAELAAAMILGFEVAAVAVPVLATVAAIGTPILLYNLLSPIMKDMVTKQIIQFYPDLNHAPPLPPPLKNHLGSLEQIDSQDGGHSFVGSSGDNLFLVSKPTSVVSEAAGGGYDLVVASSDFDLPSNVEALILFDGGKVARGNELDNLVSGNADDNLLYGGGGTDFVSGGDGNDFLAGQTGADFLTGGGGKDTFSGSVADLNGDRINDYEFGEKILVSGGAAGSSAYRMEHTATDTLIRIDEDGDGTFESTITLSGIIKGSLTMAQETDPNVTRDQSGAVYASLAIEEADVVVIGGTDGDDTLSGTPGDDSLDGGAGNDYLSGLEGNDTIVGGTGNDSIFGNLGDDILDGGDGDDALYGGMDSDQLYGGAGSDQLYDSDNFQAGEADTLSGGAGDDTINSYGGADTIDGGDGFDRLTINRSGSADGISFTAASTDTVTSMSDGGSFVHVEQISFIGSDGNDVVSTLDGDDFISGGDGDDTLSGGGGNDQIMAGAGNDTLNGGDGNDYLAGSLGDDTIDGGAGDDTIYADEGFDHVDAGAGNDTIYSYGGADTIDGGEGFDRLSLDRSGLASGITLAVANPDEAATASDGTSIIHVEQISFYGGAGDDHITAGNGDDYLQGGEGNNILLGGGGFDNLYGGGGNDFLDVGLGGGSAYGYGGDDILVGGADQYSYLSGGDGNDTLTLGGLGGSASGEAGNDTLTGGSGNDSLSGGGGNDEIHGGEGSDQLYDDDYSVSSTGDDILDGGAGDDTIASYGGADTIDGGEGFDRLTLDRTYQTGGLSFIQSDGVTHMSDGGSFSNIEQVQFYGGTGDDNVSTLGGDDTLYGRDGDDALSGGAGYDYMDGGVGNDVLDVGTGGGQAYGAEGDDRLIAGSGQIYLNGGVGIDVAVLSGNFSDFAVSQWGDTGVILVDQRVVNSGQSIQIAEVESFEFADGTRSLDSVIHSPRSIAIDSATVAENSANGTVVGILSATDPDAGDTLTFSLLDDAGGRFALSGNQLVVSGALDFETAASHSVTARVTDAAGNTYDKTFTISVLDVDDSVNLPPTDISLSASSIAENSPAGTVVGALATADPDNGETFTYQLLNDAGGRFGLFGNQIVAAGLLDHEAASSYQITVRVTDSQNHTFDKTFEIAVGNLDDTSPVFTTPTTAIFAENATGSVYVAQAADPDGLGSVSYGLKGADAALFDINATTGAVTFKNAPDFEAPGDQGGNNVYDIVVTATDGTHLTDHAVAITVLDKAESVGNIMNGTDAGETLEGTPGDDEIYGMGGNDTILGHDGVDWLVGGEGSDFIDGGEGNGEDVVVYSDKGEDGGGAVTVNLSNVQVGSQAAHSATDTYGDTDTLVNIDEVFGTMKGDTIIGSTDGSYNGFWGLGGDDTLVGGSHDTWIYYHRDLDFGGSAGVKVNLSDVQHDSQAAHSATDGFGDTDTLVNIDRVRATANDDVVYGNDASNMFQMLDGDDFVDGGNGTDMIDYSKDNRSGTATHGVFVNLSGVAQASFLGTVAAHSAIGIFNDSDSLNSIEEVMGTDFDDVMIAAQNPDKYQGFWGLAGNDTIKGGGKQSWVYYYDDANSGGGAGVVVNLSDIEQNGQAAHTARDGFGDTDTLINVGSVVGTNSADIFYGDGKQNQFELKRGDDFVDGGDGHDFVGYNLENDGSATHGVFVNFSNETKTSQLGTVGPHSAIDIYGGIDTLISIEEAGGSEFDDVFVAEPDAGKYQGFWGLAGNDTIVGGGSNTWAYYDEDASYGGASGVIVNLSDTAQGGQAAHTATDGFGDTDTLNGVGGVKATASNDRIYGNAGDNQFQLGAGNDFADGGDGNDTIDYSYDDDGTAAHGALVNLSSQTFATSLGTIGPRSAVGLYGDSDSLLNIENVTGSHLGDYIIGNGQDNVLEGLEGDDTLIGGAGNDRFYGGRGSDTMDGGTGLDTVDYSRDVRDDGSTDGVQVNLLGNGPAQDLLLEADQARDIWGSIDTVTNIRNVVGTRYDDTIYGGNHGNLLEGGAGNDKLMGGVDNDTLDGGDGTDTAIFEGNRGDYLVTENADGTVTVADQRAGGLDGVDTLKNIELLKFADRTVPAADNSAPTIIGGDNATVSIGENVKLVTKIVTTDPDVGDSLIYSIIGGDDQARFTIDPATGDLSFIAAADHESPADADGNNVYKVVVQVSDGRGGVDTQALEVTVGNLNDSAPVVVSPATATVAENMTGVVYTVQATDADNLGSLTYSLSGTDAALFKIDTATGAVSFKDAPNFEAPADAGADNVYDIQVIVSDGTLSGALAVGITVTDVAENTINTPPTITGGDRVEISLDENTKAVTTIMSTDPDAGEVATYSITGGADASLFSIDTQTGALAFIAAPDFEQPNANGGPADQKYEVLVRATDSHGEFDEQLVTVNVANVNDNAPVFTSDVAVSVAENATGPVYHAQATDADNLDPLTYSLGGADAALFNIDSATGAVSFKATPDFEHPTDNGGNNTYEVTVTATDGKLSTDQSVSVAVTNVVEAPTDLLLSNSSIREFPADDALVGLVQFEKPDAAVTGGTFSLADDAGGRFTIRGNEIHVSRSALLDFEQSSTHEISVIATDSQGNTLVKTFTITIGDINPEVLTGSVGNDTLYGGAGNDQFWGDQGNDTLVGGAGDDYLAGQFGQDILTGGTGADVFTGSVSDWDGDRITDYEYGEKILVAFGSTSPNAYRLDHVGNDTLIRIDVDGNGSFDTAITLSGHIEGTLSVAHEDDTNVTHDPNPVYTRLVITPNSPVISSDGGGDTAAVEIDENGSGVTTVTATDPSNTHSMAYSIIGGADGAKFVIDETTGTLTFAEQPDYEAKADTDGDNVYEVVVQALDGLGKSDTQTINVTVANVNDNAPAFSSGATATFTENATGTVYDATATDADNLASLSYSLGGDDAALFDVDPSTGVISFKSSPNFEAPADKDGNNIYNIVVTASDGSNSTNQSVAITVTNMNDNAPVFTSVAAASFAENATGTVYDANATDADNLGALTYSLGGTDAALFNIDPATGMVSFRSSPNFEAPSDANGNNVYEIVVSATDGTFATDRAVLITVTDVSEGTTPPITGNSGNNTLNGTPGNDVLDGAAGDDTLNGLAGNDRLIGGSGSDMLNGGTGADLMQGGAGGDTYVVDNTGDVVDETGGGGNDTVQASIAFSLAVSATVLGDIENLTLTGTASIDGTGNGLNNTITGNSGDNRLNGGGGSDTLVGNAGNDMLDGGAGADTMRGGNGNDVYVVDSTGDRVDESGSNGTDTVTSSVDFSLSSNRVSGSVENLMLIGAADIDATGNALNNTLVGNSGDNVLDGGAGRDLMQGGGGDDTYVVDNNFDTVDESVAGSGGIDTVRVSMDFSLAPSSRVLGQIENLVLTGSNDIDGTGNDLDNAITGNSGDNVLSGGGGNDAVDGGRGDDTLLGGSGNDALLGGAGSDRLDGGTGADAMAGGSGNDVYLVDNAGDTVRENVRDGTDTVQTTLTTFTLPDNVENLVFTGSGSFAGVGNGLDNSITGGTGSDTLNGGAGDDILTGGAGSDFLTGGSGADQFVFNVSLASTGVDTITDFVTRAANATVHDRIVLSNANGMFSQLQDGTLSNAAFVVANGGQAQDASDRIIYDPTTGWLNYDSNGSVAGGTQIHFATLQPGLNLHAADILVV